MDIITVFNLFEEILNYGFVLYGYYFTLGQLIMYIFILALLVLMLGAFLK